MHRLTPSLARAVACSLVVTAVAAARPVSAQSDFGSTSEPQTAAKWSFRPSVVFSSGWDDNVFIKGEGDETAGDLLNVVNPRADIGFNGRRGLFAASYDGAFLLYREQGSLNSYDQHMSMAVRRLVARHVTIFARNGFAVVPTTQSVELVGVPFVRTGSTIDDFQSGMEVGLSKRTTMNAVYNFQWVRFEDDPTLTTILRGGYSHGGSVAFRHLVSSRLTAVADYALQYALVSETLERFTVQNADAGLEYALSDKVPVFAAVGVSRLGVSASGPARIGPSVRAGIGRRFEAADTGLTYIRSFIPSYGFGGTTQNEELTAHVQLPLSRRLYQQTSVAWRRNEPLTVGQPSLRSLWIEAAVGYSLLPSIRIEGFYGGAHQVIDRPGGVTNRNRFGFQAVTSKAMRIR